MLAAFQRATHNFQVIVSFCRRIDFRAFVGHGRISSSPPRPVNFVIIFEGASVRGRAKADSFFQSSANQSHVLNSIARRDPINCEFFDFSPVL